MVEQLVNQVNWPAVFYVCFALFVLVILENVIGLSFVKFFAGISREIRSLLRQGPLDRAKINGITVIILGLIIAFYFLVEPVRKLVELTHEIRSAAEPTYVFLISLFVLAVTGYLSVLSVDRR